MSMDEYNVSKYTDSELHQILNLSSPSDRVLEQQIYVMLNKYESNRKLYMFFYDIFTHFFESEEDEDNFEGQEGFTSTNTSSSASSAPTASSASTASSAPTASAIATLTAVLQEPMSGPVITKNFNYVPDKLNPLLKESIKRIISIDSQFRDHVLYPYSTSYTFNLSEPLNDVVSMKLYSIHLPFTWYTVSNDFGSNFFFIKGNSPGINQSSFDYKVQIPSGNYQSADFVKAVNTSIASIAILNPDVNFGTTGISFNTTNAKLTTTIDIKNLFDERYYAVSFPAPATSVVPNHSSSIADLLGFNVETPYLPYTIQSPLTLTELETNSTLYTMTTQSLTIQIYDPVQDASYNVISNPYPEFNQMDTSSNYIVQTITISPSLSIVASQGSSGLAIKNDFNTQILSSTFLTNSGFNVTEQGTTFSLLLNRKTVINNINLKAVILFNEPLGNNFWFGPQSLFQLPTPNVTTVYPRYIELQNIVSPNASKKTEYSFTTPPQIEFMCTNTLFDPLIYSLSITSGLGTGRYALSEYLSTVNNAFNTFNYTGTPFNVSLSTINASINIITNSTLTSCRPRISAKMNNVITDNVTANINIIGSMLKKLLPNESVLVNNNVNVYSGSIQGIQGNNFDLLQNTFIVNLPHAGSISVTIPPASIGDTNTLAQLQNLNTYFAKASIYNSNIDLSQCAITNIVSNDNGLISYTIKWNVRIVLSEKDYRIVLKDSTWSKYLYFDASSNTASIDSNSTTVYDNLLLLDATNNFFTLSPANILGSGIYTGDTTYQTVIQLSDLALNNYYTKEEIVKSINTQLASNAISIGSLVNAEDGAQTSLRVNMNKIFTTANYKLVYYDVFSFNRCNFGVPINTTQDTTLGWIFGYRNTTEYPLGAAYITNDVLTETSQYYSTYKTQPYAFDASNIATLTGDTSVNVNLYNYAMLILDDYTVNHLNDGLVTITSADHSVPLPSYAARNNIRCAIPPTTNASSTMRTIGTAPVGTTGNQLTANQIYAASQVISSQQAKTANPFTAPFTQDVFGIIPLRIQGLQPGQSYVEFSGTLQNQERIYLGPVNLRRMTVQLLNDKGTLLNLNGANWSMSFLAEQLYNPNRG